MASVLNTQAQDSVTQAQGETIETRVGKLSFTHDFANGYPTKETVKLLFDEMDFQRACQAYIWGIPGPARILGQLVRIGGCAFGRRTLHHDPCLCPERQSRRIGHDETKSYGIG